MPKGIIPDQDKGYLVDHMRAEDIGRLEVRNAKGDRVPWPP